MLPRSLVSLCEPFRDRSRGVTAGQLDFRVPLPDRPHEDRAGATAGAGRPCRTCKRGIGDRTAHSQARLREPTLPDLRGRGRACRSGGNAGRAGPPARHPRRFHPVRDTLLGVALFHHHTLRVALAGLAVITLTSSPSPASRPEPAFAGLGPPAARVGDPDQSVPLLMGFALLSRHFEKSRIPDEMPRFLPDDWKGCFALLAIVFVLSSFLDNIAAALIGGAMAHHVFRGKVHIGYLAAIVAASNAGGSGQRGRRHHHHDDVDRRGQPARGDGSLSRGHRRACDLRYSGVAPAAALLADPQARPSGLRIDWTRVGDRGPHPDRGDRRQRDHQHRVFRHFRSVSVHRRCGVGGDPAHAPLRRPDW